MIPANVTVTVKQLSGLICDQVSSSNTAHLSPIFAVASFARKTLSSETSIQTHVPSLQMGGMMVPHFRPKEKKLESNIRRYNAQWAAYDDLIIDPDDVAQSSYSFSHRFPSNSVSRYECQNPDANEFVDVELGLIRGSEMIALGSTTIAISALSASNNSDIVNSVNLMVRDEVVGSSKKDKQKHVSSSSSVISNTSCSSPKKGLKNMLTRTKSFKQAPQATLKKIKYASFPSDPSRRYSLSENATLSVQITISFPNASNETTNRGIPEGRTAPPLMSSPLSPSSSQMRNNPIKKTPKFSLLHCTSSKPLSDSGEDPRRDFVSCCSMSNILFPFVGEQHYE